MLSTVLGRWSPASSFTINFFFGCAMLTSIACVACRACRSSGIVTHVPIHTKYPIQTAVRTWRWACNFLVALCLQVSLVPHVELAVYQAYFLQCDTHTRTHAQTHTDTHTHTHTHTDRNQETCLPVAGNWQQLALCWGSGLDLKYKMLTCERCQTSRHTQLCWKYYTLVRPGDSHN